MIPIGDSVRSRSFPYANVTIIGINFLVFFYELTLNSGQVNRFICDYGAIPWEVADYFGRAGRPALMGSPCRIHQGDASALWHVVTSMFVHAGWLHILGNMLFLWIFGDNVEDAMGHIPYAIFYLLVGLAASATQIAVNVNETIPAVGASGAIAGVMGAYLVMFPRARVTVLLPIIFFIPLVVPAVVLIGVWFLMQVFSSAAAVGTAVGGSEGVAWFAHIGGFIAGLVLVFVFRRPGRVQAQYRQGPDVARWS